MVATGTGDLSEEILEVAREYLEEPSEDSAQARTEISVQARPANCSAEEWNELTRAQQ